MQCPGTMRFVIVLIMFESHAASRAFVGVVKIVAIFLDAHCTSELCSPANSAGNPHQQQLESVNMVTTLVTQQSATRFYLPET